MTYDLRKKIQRARAVIALTLALLPASALAQGQQLNNPANAPDFQTFIANFLKAIVQISLPILTLYIVYSGFMFVMARGNEAQLEKAKHNFFYVIIGAILILGAWVLATLIASTANQILGGS